MIFYAIIKYFKKQRMYIMADEPKPNGNEPTPTPGAEGGEATVTMTQAKLDELINGKFKKGAEKANADTLKDLGVDDMDSLKSILKAKNDADEASKTELQKAQDAVEAMKLINNDLISKGEKLEESNRISKLASKNEVKDADYFAFKYAQAKASEDFNEDTFVKTFKDGNPTAPPSTDSTKNKSDNPNYNGKDLKKMSINELKAYQATL